jgi:hypothetical protein
MRVIRIFATTTPILGILFSVTEQDFGRKTEVMAAMTRGFKEWVGTCLLGTRT